MRMLAMFVILLCLTMGTNGVFADEMTDGQDMQKQVAVEVGNKFCPVSGGPVGQMGDPYKVEYEGRVYNLCCKMCERDFKADPEKYSQIAEEEVMEQEQTEESQQ